jgi:hypothetical protein
LIFRIKSIISVSKQGKYAATEFRFLIWNSLQSSFPVWLQGGPRESFDPSQDGA